MSPTGRTGGGSGSGSSSISAPQGQTTWSAVTLTASTTRLSAIIKVNQIRLAALRRSQSKPVSDKARRHSVGQFLVFIIVRPAVLVLDLLLLCLILPRRLFIARSVVVDDISRSLAFKRWIIACHGLVAHRRELFMTVTVRCKLIFANDAVSG